MVASSTSETSKKKKSNKRKRTQQSHEVEKLDSLKWNSPLSADDNDPFALLVGSNELDGGFLSLEEIDEVDYNLQIPKSEEEKPDKKPKSKKWKHSDAGDGDEGGGGEKMEEEKNLKIEKAKKKKKKKRKKTNKNEESVAVHGAQDDADKELVDKAEVPPEYDAWNELRLHPSLMKSIYRLGFKEPTPIQKACIPAAADQGKDVIGAAKTGSGKMLAFGLLIIRL